jgi:hypothetical protein
VGGITPSAREPEGIADSGKQELDADRDQEKDEGLEARNVRIPVTPSGV